MIRLRLQRGYVPSSRIHIIYNNSPSESIARTHVQPENVSFLSFFPFLPSSPPLPLLQLSTRGKKFFHSSNVRSSILFDLRIVFDRNQINFSNPPPPPHLPKFFVRIPRLLHRVEDEARAARGAEAEIQKFRGASVVITRVERERREGGERGWGGRRGNCAFVIN